jgi:hypothetical protein
VFLELVDALRCIRPHEETWLVAAMDRVDGREIIDGMLGCPICHAEYPVRDGVADFTAGGVAVPSQAADSRESAMRLAALLDLTDGRGWALLVGSWGSIARELQSIVSNPLVLVNPPAGTGSGHGVSVLLASASLPIAMGAARCAALDESLSWSVAPAIAAVRTGGRIVGRTGLTLPEGVREIARDEMGWVGEREPAPGHVIPITSRARR